MRTRAVGGTRIGTRGSARRFRAARLRRLGTRCGSLGGCGIRRDLRFLADEGKLTNLSERQRFAPYGLFGGQPGTLATTVINPGPGEQRVHGKQSREFAYGDVISFQQSGAGGYGEPFARDPEAVLADVLDEYVSVEAARKEYGVVLTDSSAAVRVDAAATRALRAAPR